MNMKRNLTLWIAGSCAALALATAAHAQVAPGKFVTVDLNRIFNDYYKTPIASAKLKEAATAYNKEHDDMMAEFKKQVDELNKMREDAEKPEYTPEVRAQKQKAVTERLQAAQKGERDITEFRRTHQRALEEQTQRMRQTILKEVAEVIQKEARDAGYQIVFDKSGNSMNGVPGIVYSADTMDITEDIVKILNKNAPKPDSSAPKPDEKK
jgi:outer membrane protein